MESKLKAILETFPSSFQTNKFVKKLSTETKQTILDRILKQRQTCIYEIEIEKHMDLNVIAFLYFSLGKHDSAFKTNEDVLGKDGHNINALTCCAWFRLYNNEISKCSDLCVKLEEMKSDKAGLLIAKGEVGYICSRLGMKKYKDAEVMFNEALKGSTEKDVHVPDEYICVWKSGLALTIRRQLYIHNLHVENISSQGSIKERSNEAVKYFIDIIKMKANKNFDKHKADAFVQIGEILNNFHKLLDKKLLDELRGSDMEEKTRFCYELGLDNQPNNVFVLERCAKYFKRSGQIDRSIQLCRRALDIRETSTAHHYLAIALKENLKSRRRYQDIKNQNESGERNNDWQTVTRRRHCKPGRAETANQGFQHTHFQQKQTFTQDKYCKPTPNKTNYGHMEQARHNAEERTNRSYVEPLPPDQIGDIIEHLDRAVQQHQNIGALYEKGLVMRAAGQYHNALGVFKSMFCNARSSLVQLAGAYEQAAHCLIKTCEITTTKQENIEIDVKDYLLKSIEVQCNIVAKVPKSRSFWSSFPTLKSLLEKHHRSKYTYVPQELRHLHEKVQNYSEAICWIQHALHAETKSSQKATTHMDIVNNILKTENYNEAILYIDMVQCFPDGRSNVAEDLQNVYFKAHIEGGIEAFKVGEKELASIRLKNALDCKRFGINTEQSDAGEEDDSIKQEWFDVFILCEQTSESIGRNVLGKFRTLGLECQLQTLNDDVASADLSVLDVIDCSTHSLVILGENIKTMKYIKHLTTIINTTQLEHGFGHTVVVTENENVQIDPMFRGFARMQYDEISSSIEETVSGVKNLLLMLASGTLS